MSIGRKILILAMSLLLPTTLLISTQGLSLALARVSDSDRAIIWVQGNVAEIAQVRLDVKNSAAFPQGRTRPASPSFPAPKHCANDAVELSFGGLHLGVVKSAREELETAAKRAGVLVCARNIVRINDPGAEAFGDKAWFATQHALLRFFVPAGLCLCLYWAFRDQFTLPLLTLSNGSIRNFALGLVAAILLLAVSSVFSLEPDLRSGLTTPTPINIEEAWWLFVLLALSPLAEEIAFRVWMITLSERVLGSLGAGLLSTLAFTLVKSPSTLHDVVMTVALGAVCSALYLRTRSLIAVASAHTGYVLLLFYINLVLS